MELTANYFKAPNDIFNLGLKPNQFVVAMAILRFNNNGGTAYFGYKKIAEMCNIGLSTAKRVVKELVDMGIVAKQERKVKCDDGKETNETNIYTVTEKVIANCVAKPSVESQIFGDVADDEEVFKSEQVEGAKFVEEMVEGVENREKTPVISQDVVAQGVELSEKIGASQVSCISLMEIVAQRGLNISVDDIVARFKKYLEMGKSNPFGQCFNEIMLGQIPA